MARQLISSPFRLVTTLLAAGACTTFAVLLVRVAQLQIKPSAQLVGEMSPRVSTKPDLALRGDIVDRRGRLLAGTRFGLRVVIDPTLVDQERFAEFSLKLSKAIGAEERKFSDRIVAAFEENIRRQSVAAEVDPNAKVAGELIAKGSIEADPQAPSEVTPFEADARATNPQHSALTGAIVLDGPAIVPPVAKPKKPIRYLVMSDVLPDERADEVKRLVKAEKFKGVQLEQRQVREFIGGPEIAAIVGKDSNDPAGRIGIENLKHEQLSGREGKISFVRAGSGAPLWIEPGQVVASTPGSNVQLTIDLELQRIAFEELTRGVEEKNAQGGRCLLVDPNTGEILAMVDIMRDVPGLVEYPWIDKPKPGEKAPPLRRDGEKALSGARFRILNEDKGRRVHPALSRNRCVEEMYEPGSTFKPYVWSTITDLKLARPDEIFDTEGGRWHTSYGRYVEDVTKRESMTWTQVLVNSSNIGMIKGAERLTWQQLHDACERFGFGKKTGIELPYESPGRVTPMSLWKNFTQTSVAFGQEVAITPVQMVRAFCVFSRSGEAAGTLPQLHITKNSGEPRSDITVRVLPPDVAVLTRNTLAGVTESMERVNLKSKPWDWRYTIYGKSGTADVPLETPKGKMNPFAKVGFYPDTFRTSFIAGGPIEQPRLVCLVVIDDPRVPKGEDRRRRYGASSAGPVVRRVLERALTYLGAPPSDRLQDPDAAKKAAAALNELAPE